MVAALLCIAGLLGPPKLPPMPGQGVPAEPKPSTPTAKPSAPTAKPSSPTAKPSAKPSTPPAKPSAPPSQPSKLPTATPAPEPPPPAFAPEPVGTPEDPFQLPDAKTEPPQPEPTAKPPPGEAPPSTRGGKAPAPAPRPGEIPGEADRATLKIPPPKKPPFTGVGLFAGAGISFAIALTEQIVAHRLVKKRCIDPVAAQSKANDPPEEEAEQIGNSIIKCVPGILPAIALRVNSDLALISAISMAAAGAVLRAQRNAYDDAFASRSRKDIVKLRWAGIGLIIGGAVTYLVTGPTAWGILAKCDTGKCAARARIMGFATRDVSAVMIASGAGMLGFSESYRRRHEAYSRDRALAFSPAFGRGFAGLSLTGRF